MYTAKSDTTGLSTSRPLSLNVINPGSEHPSLPRPGVPEANGAELDLGSFNGDATVTLAAWPFMATGQRLWLTLSWTGGGIMIVTAHPLTPTEVGTTLHYTIARSVLEAIADGAAMTLRAAVAFDESSDETHSVWFPALSLTLRTDGPAFYIDPSTMELGVGESKSRPARGGRPPYIYVSSDAAIASVDSTGLVTGTKAGSASVTANDARGQSGSYYASVTSPEDIETFDDLDGSYPSPLTRPSMVITRGPTVTNMSVVGGRLNVTCDVFYQRMVTLTFRRDPRRITLDYDFMGAAATVTFIDSTGYIWREDVSGKAKLQMAAQNGRTIASVHFRTDYHGEQFVDNIHMLYG